VSAPPQGAREVRRFPDAEALSRAAAEEITRAAERAVAERGAFTIALAGAATPRPVYALLADPAEPFRARVRWDRTHVFFGDDRHVPPDHPDSNFRSADETLLSRVPVAGVHRMRTELGDANEAALRYEEELRGFFRLRRADDPPPELDVVLLGVGEDGHTASLFPGSEALGERRRWVLAPLVRHLGAHRLTLTLPVLCRGREVLFLARGAAKAEAVARALAPGPGAEPVPAARVHADAEHDVVWLVDDAAAARLPS
jgi:6-phosphogluconolactonase